MLLFTFEKDLARWEYREGILGCVSSSRDEGLSDIPEFQVREADG